MNKENCTIKLVDEINLSIVLKSVAKSRNFEFHSSLTKLTDILHITLHLHFTLRL